ncbi:MAG: VacJ family lipoprotein [Lautropia sp.]
MIALLLPLLAACATSGANPRDPLESFNRPVYQFNDALDRYALKPVAQGYRKVVPDALQLMISSFFANLGDLYTGVNNLLQAKPKAALIDVSRFVLNSTLGFAGVADIASAIGMPKHYEDFGQTLGWWGVPSGPYLVLPFFGPSTVRDAPARIVDTYGDPVAMYHDVRLRNTGLGLRLVDTRASLLDAERVVDSAALDRYSLIRDGWLQRRRNAVYDGDPPDEDEEPLEDDSGYSESKAEERKADKAAAPGGSAGAAAPAGSPAGGGAAGGGTGGGGTGGGGSGGAGGGGGASGGSAN